MRFASLGSGSKGNATLIEAGGTRVLVDCGFSLRELRRRLATLECEPRQLNAVLITHEHADHSKGVVTLAKNHGLPVYMTHGTRLALSLGWGPMLRIISPDQPFSVGGLEVLPVPVPHDAREPVQFLFGHGGLSLGLLTDLGHISPHVQDCYKACDGLLLESNHDAQMLAEGPYPYPLKQRVGGQWGHLNNTQTADLLAGVDRTRLQALVVGHISEQNNNLDLVRGALAGVVTGIPRVSYAAQGEASDWHGLA